jgi:phytoene/squalene synthetase
MNLPHPTAEALWTHAHSFRWGWIFFPAEVREKIAHLYAALRWVDDYIDEAAPEEAPARFAQLQTWHDSALSRRTQDLPLIVSTVIAQGTSYESWAEFFSGQLMDASAQPCPDQPSRDRYCQGVAGVVGVMFCQLLAITSSEAQARARSLGQAMQLTNMVRDLVEDARRGRSYLAEHTPQDILEAAHDDASPTRRTIEAVALTWLDEADTHYHHGQAGLDALPYRAAIGVAVGAQLYRRIGQKIRQNPSRLWRERVRTHRGEKIFLCLRAIIKVTLQRLGFRISL